MAVIIAIVEDDEAILDAVQILLEGEGWQVRTYSSGGAFLQDLDDRQPDCVILDPHMPGLSGADVARSMAREHADIPIIGLTARPNSWVTEAMLHAGARVILRKPVTFESLLEHILSAIGDATARRQGA
jgi:FixJ family two-component response regulator